MKLLKLFFVFHCALLTLSNGASDLNPTQSPQAFHNQAARDWEGKHPDATVENLLKSIQLRTNPVKILAELGLISEIQTALFAQPSPIHSARLKLAFLWSPNIQTIWFSLFFLGFVLSLWLRFGRIFNSSASSKILALSFLGVGVGMLLTFNQKNVRLPSILIGKEPLVTVFKNPSANPDDKLIELPIGLLVTVEQEQENWIGISEPVLGWVQREQLRPFPVL